MKECVTRLIEYIVHAVVFFLIGAAVYVHTVNPVTKRFLESHEIEVVQADSVEAAEYTERCNRVLFWTYLLSVLVPCYAAICAFRGSVFSVLVLIPYGILVFFQVYGYFVYRASYETYRIISIGV